MALTDRGANYRVFDKKFSDVVIGYIDYLPANTKEPYLYEMFRKQFGAKFIKKMKRGEMVKIPSDHSEMYMIWMSGSMNWACSCFCWSLKVCNFYSKSCLTECTSARG